MRPIDADKLKRKVQKCATEAWKMNLTARIETVLNQFIDWIDEAPTVEPERKKGKWIKLYAGNYKCSVCGDWWGNDDNEMVEDFKYCPNCGCEMER